MLNARNVILVVILVAGLSVIAACASLLQSPGGRGIGTDSYGTRPNGFRGLLEILAELHVPAERAVVPPNQLLERQVTLAFLDPNMVFTATEPAFLNAVGRWVREGGCVVVGPSLVRIESAAVAGLDRYPKSVLAELGLEDVRARWIGPEPNEFETVADKVNKSITEDAKDTAGHTAAWLKKDSTPKLRPRVHATADGILAASFPNGLRLVLPDSGLRVLDPDGEPAREPQKKSAPIEKTGRSDERPASHKQGGLTSDPVRLKDSGGKHSVVRSDAKPPSAKKPRPPKELQPEHSPAALSPPALPAPLLLGRLRAFVGPDDNRYTLAAVYRVGEGRMAVVADPRLFQNGLISEGDNAVLATHLLADFGRPVVFDEFYHGLTVRGNPLWLLTRFPYGLLAVAALVATVVVGWRAARFLGPPLAAPQSSRRSLAEYIEAMSRLLNRTRRPVHYLLRQIRSGLVWRIRHEMNLPPGPDDAEPAVRALAMRDAQAAKEAREAFSAIDAALEQRQPSRKTLESTFAKVSRVVSRNAV